MKTKAEYHAEKFRKRHGIGKNDIMMLYGYPFRVYTRWKQQQKIIFHDEELLDYFLDDDDTREMADLIWVHREKHGIRSTACHTGIFTFPDIYMSKTAFSFPTKMIEVIFYHELGHCLLHALDNTLRPLFPQFADLDAYRKILMHDLTKTLFEYYQETGDETAICMLKSGNLPDADPRTYAGLYLLAVGKQKVLLVEYLDEICADGTPPLGFRRDALNIIEDICKGEGFPSIYRTTTESITAIVEIEADLFAIANLSFDDVAYYYDRIFSVYKKLHITAERDPYTRHIFQLFDILIKVYNDPRIQELLPYYKFMDPEEWKAKFVKR